MILSSQRISDTPTPNVHLDYHADSGRSARLNEPAPPNAGLNNLVRVIDVSATSSSTRLIHHREISGAAEVALLTGQKIRYLAFRRGMVRAAVVRNGSDGRLLLKLRCNLKKSTPLPDNTD